MSDTFSCSGCGARITVGPGDFPTSGTVVLPVTVTPKPVPDTTYTLTYDGNADDATGTPAPDTYTGKEDSHAFTITTKEPTREGYTFKGWADKADATAPTYQPGSNITLTKDASTKTIYAVWEKNPEPPHEHKWDDGKVTKEPTCTEKGEKTYTCVDCGETKTEEIPAKGHTDSDWKHNGTKHWQVCPDCGKTIKKGNHVDSNGDGKCDTCGAKIDKSVYDVPAKTGDTRPIALMVTMFLISAAAICLLLVHYFRKRSRK